MAVKMERETETQKHRQRETQRQRDTETERDIETDTERDTERQRQCLGLEALCNTAAVRHVSSVTFPHYNTA